MSYDPECYKLAEHILPTQAPEYLKNSLADYIQTAIEDWLEITKEGIERQVEILRQRKESKL